MEHLGSEVDLRGLVGVLVGELEGEVESPFFPDGVFWADHDCGPAHDIGLIGTGDDVVIILSLDFLEVLHQPLHSLT